MHTPWPHQERGVQSVLQKIAEGHCRILFFSPTGTGKSFVMAMLVKHYLDQGKRVVIYTNRRMLLDQSSRVFGGWEIDHGVRAPGHTDERWKPFQIASLQTEVLRLKSPDKNRGWTLHEADLVLIDEAHVNGGPTVQKIAEHHVQHGAVILGFTATPIDLGHMYDVMIEGCSLKEGRSCGALVPALVYGPDEPDLKRIKQVAGEDISENQQRQVMMTPTIYGRVWDWFNKLNPAHKPTIGFAPGVAESFGFAADFHRRGIGAAHIDGEKVWINGKEFESSPTVRDELQQMHKEGEIKVLWNRFVCLDMETEILTASGWVDCDDMTGGHQVANWDNGTVTFSPPLEIVRRPRGSDERMVVLETPRRSIRVTESHELLYRTTVAGRFLKKAAADLVDKPVCLPVCGMAAAPTVDVPQESNRSSRARRIASNTYMLKTRGVVASEARRLAEEREAARYTLRRKSPHELTESECEFIGFWLGDGNRSRLSSGGVEYRMWQGTDCPSIVRRLDALLDEIGVDAIKKKLKHANCIQWSMPRGTGGGSQKRRGLYHLEPYLVKEGTPLFWSLNKPRFDALIRGLWMADGQHGDNTVPSNRILITASVPTLFDLLQAIAVCRGWRASIRQYRQSQGGLLFYLTMTEQADHSMTKYRLGFEDGWKEEEVWCVRTKSGNIITRRNGSVTVMGNCREGIDMPWIEVGILASVFGSLQSNIQAVGRVLRASPKTGKKHAVLIDHGGNWWRHGSPNADRDWKLEYTSAMISGMREEKLRYKGEKEPYRCPNCTLILAAKECPGCGHKVNYELRARAVVQIDGSLKMMRGEIFKPRKVDQSSSGPERWKKMYFRAKAAGSTFRQAEALYATENFWQWPNRDWPLMPLYANDWFRRVKDVPMESLRR